MTTNDAVPTTEIEVLDPQLFDAERYALGAFLAGCLTLAASHR